MFSTAIRGHFPHIPVEVTLRPFIKPAQKLIHKIQDFVKTIFTSLAKVFSLHNPETVKKGSYHASYKGPNKPEGLKNPLVVFAFDGGGVKGKIILAALKIIEELTGKPISKLGTILAGVSTGGIIAAALSIPKPDNPNEPRLTAVDVDHLYDSLAEEVFTSSYFNFGLTENKYPSPGPVIRKIVGDLPLTASVAQNILITSCDACTESLVCFSNKEISQDYLPNGCIMAPQSATFADAAEATSAAPTYFPSVPFNGYNLIDGGVINNNPAQLATLYAMSIAKDRDILVLSFGTGDGPIDDTISKTKALFWGVIQWFTRILNIVMKTATSQVDWQLDLLSRIYPNVHYVRWQVSLPTAKDAQMDRADPAHLQWLGDYGTKCFNDFLAKGGDKLIIDPLKQIS